MWYLHTVVTMAESTLFTLQALHFMVRPDSALRLYFGDDFVESAPARTLTALRMTLAIAGAASIVLAALLCVSARFMSKAKCRSLGQAHVVAAAFFGWSIFGSTALVDAGFPIRPYMLWAVVNGLLGLFFLTTTSIARRYDPSAMPPLSSDDAAAATKSE
ncbi:uncharacterized protein AMSG_04805 [Thecamonas trahens ATCC 50062]|uniref:Uncharacterized protein n=1 Tax=Thecamonas trahens ATCC 50062 TaxID=461836 RepID=A0A0L0D8E7_THETB|nr:hypothetical protein AMSG_04805 [Thecamonas trahens ATCC 50062]KNC48356.1 hypothetical protein AMSG_04805 [Thecamonas trahens ATCC 50062]|eukprot:XP_013758478.1 hypothetical protein AMSG_04805 [Thecamonas trahens ATCC 50062]